MTRMLLSSLDQARTLYHSNFFLLHLLDMFAGPTYWAEVARLCILKIKRGRRHRYRSWQKHANVLSNAALSVDNEFQGCKAFWGSLPDLPTTHSFGRLCESLIAKKSNTQIEWAFFIAFRWPLHPRSKSPIFVCLWFLNKIFSRTIWWDLMSALLVLHVWHVWRLQNRASPALLWQCICLRSLYLEKYSA